MHYQLRIHLKIGFHHHFQFNKVDISDRQAVETLFKSQPITKVIHLAAQAGVRYSIENPHSYIDSNIVGFCHILEGCRHHHIEHLVYASSSSVYGASKQYPFKENINVACVLTILSIYSLVTYVYFKTTYR